MTAQALPSGPGVFAAALLLLAVGVGVAGLFLRAIARRFGPPPEAPRPVCPIGVPIAVLGAHLLIILSWAWAIPEATFEQRLLGNMAAQLAAVVVTLALLGGMRTGARRILLPGPVPAARLAPLAWLGYLPAHIGIAVAWFVGWQLAMGTAPPKQEMVSAALETLPPMAWVIFVTSAVLVAPLAEETFFRGLLLPLLVPRLGKVGAVLVSAVLFALAHRQPGAFGPLLGLGILLGWLRVRSGGLLPSIVTHATQNGISLAIAAIVGPLLGG